MARKRPAVSRFLVEPLERRALFSVAPLTFTDGDGTLVKITLSGNGSVSLVPAGGKFVLVNQNEWGDGEVVPGLHVIPFVEHHASTSARPPTTQRQLRK